MRRCHTFVLLLLQALRQDDKQTDRQTDVEPGRQGDKQTVIGAVRQAVSPGIL